MFRAQPLYHMTLWCLASEVQDVALLLAREGVYCPASDPSAGPPGAKWEEYRDTYAEARTRLDKILPICDMRAPPPVPADALAPSLQEMHLINSELKEVWRICAESQMLEDEVERERRELASLEETYARLRGLHQDITTLLKPEAMIRARIGQVPNSNARRLQEALGLAGYLLLPFDQIGAQTFALIAGPRNKGELGDLLAQAGWRNLPIPPELQTRPENAEAYLRAQKQGLDERLNVQRELRKHRLDHYLDQIRQAWVCLTLAQPLAESALGALKDRGALTVLSGWLPRSALPALGTALDHHFPQRHVLSVREPGLREAAPIPSLLSYPVWLKPYIPLVRSYGVPRYGEFDPALLFAISYVLLFGAMFGDVGHGAALMGLALLLRGKLAWLRAVGLLAGASACVFGMLYGSVFGFENLIQPLWMSPMRDASRMLELAILSGVGFITATFLINIYNRLVRGQLTDALFEGHALAGLLFYAGAVLGLGNLIHGQKFGVFNAAASLGGLALIALRHWSTSQAAVAERLLVTLIETLETATNLFANTLSFLRVAAFSLNHVALALAVFTLANSLGAAGHAVTVVIGNVVIIALEGGIVAIQALRLMYYEGFSRFFSGDGVEFKPLAFGTGVHAPVGRKGRFAFKSG
ncbi:MAG: V-type ATPase 116kDa subunit family protein [Thiobacillaceae bacterium]